MFDFLIDNIFVVFGRVNWNCGLENGSSKVRGCWDTQGCFF